MAGEINGTGIILVNSSGAIVGQMAMTLTYSGTPIDVSNKSAGDNVTLIDAALSGKQIQISGELVYNSDTQFRAMRAEVITGTQDTYTITYTSDATTDESFAASMVPTAMSDSIPHGDKVSTNITFVSSGTITYTAAVT